MSHQPEVSVLMAAYNAERYLPAAIDSVQAQSFRDWELVICDDCSVDRTAEICEQFAARDPRIRLTRMERNSGLSAARNRAFAASAGKYVAILDADDACHPERISTQLEWARLHPEDVLMSGYAHMGSEGTECDLYLPTDVANAGIWACALVCGGTMLVGRELFRRLGGYSLDIRDYQDLDFVLRAALAGHSFRTIPQALYYYRLHEASLTGVDRTGFYRRVNAYLTSMWQRHLARREARTLLFERAMRGYRQTCWSKGSGGAVRRKAAAVAHQLALRFHAMGDRDFASTLLAEATRVCWWRADAQLTRLTLPAGLGLHVTSFGDRRLPRVALWRHHDVIAVV